eukprot:TRINITY_DN6563_c0_g1_i1.p1 TRINITY_DN6563_c0_g1~~TRINITY_DN6563_c0_g1_i1.p1  ORF type:complete len:239 (-),score=49.46 TRINITY_DN6563_c0_g1_i1:193-909(-)
MRDALNATGRPIYLSLCGWNAWYAPQGAVLGNSWRISRDVNAWPDVWNAVRINENLATYAGPGAWNDPDMLVGSSPHAAVHLTAAQSRTQFGLWAVMAAPLLIGSNILNLSAYDLETYTNAEVIAVNQDRLGKQGMVVSGSCPPAPNKTESSSILDCTQIWGRPLVDGAVAVAMVNWGPANTTVTCDSACLERMGLFPAPVTVRDLWARQTLPGTHRNLTFTVAGGGGSMMLRVASAT